MKFAIDLEITKSSNVAIGVCTKEYKVLKNKAGEDAHSWAFILG